MPIYEACALHHAILLAGRVFLSTLKSSLNASTLSQSPAQVDKEKTYALPDGVIITVVPNVSVARKCCSSHTVPIYDGSALHHAILRSAGRGLIVSSMRSSPSKGTLHRYHKVEKTGELPNGNINVAPNFPVV